MRVLGMCVLVAMAASPALGGYLETFSYPDGNLAGNGGWFFWTADPGIDALEVQSGAAHAYADQASPLRVGDASMDVAAVDNKVSLTMDVKMSGAGGAGWFHVWDLSGNVLLGGLYWNYAALYGRNTEKGYLVGLPSPGTDGVTVGMDFDFAASTVTFSVNGTAYGSSAFSSAVGAGNEGVGEVAFEAQTNGRGSDHEVFDNLSIVPEPASLILLGLGGLLVLRRRA